MAVQWGTAVNDYIRLGIDVSVTTGTTSCTVQIDVWFWSKYSVSDKVNTFYFNDNATSASTSMGAVSLVTSANSSWSTANQIKIYSYPAFTVNRPKSSSDLTRSCAAKINTVWTSSGEANISAATSYTIQKLPSYTISYNTNGGTAVSSQTKWYGTNIALAGAPTRTGYTFKGWATTNGGSAVYQPGNIYSADANVTLYAVWSAIAYTVSYNTNGGSTVSSQTKWYGTNITLTGTPTRTNYNFKGWATTNGGSVVYQPGNIYSANASVTLYAVWELAYVAPRISNVSVFKCTEDGTADDMNGTYINVNLTWKSDYSLVEVSTNYKTSSEGTYSTANKYTTKAYTGTSGTVSNLIIGGGNIDPELGYDIRIYVADSTTYAGTTVIRSIEGQTFAIDVIRDDYNRVGVAFGQAANIVERVRSKWRIEAPELAIGPLDGKRTIIGAGGNTIHAWDSGAQAYVHVHIHPQQYAGLIVGPESGMRSYVGPKGTIELYSGTPYVDFHRDSTESDYTSRIIDTANGLEIYNDKKLYIQPIMWAQASYNYVGWHRFNADWIGFYGSTADAYSNVSRRGFIQHDGAHLYIQNDKKDGVCRIASTDANGNVHGVSYRGGTYVFYPTTDNLIYLGATTNRWKQLYAATTTISTSDRKVKENISEINKATEFILGLEPVSFTRKDGDTGRIHMGFIAQDVAALAKEIEMGDMAVYQAARIETVVNEDGEEEQIAHYYSEDDPDEELAWGLGYEEFIAPMVATIQSQNEQIQSQQSQINDLQAQVNELKSLVTTLLEQQGV